LPLDPRSADSVLAEDDGFLRAIRVRSTTCFGGEVKVWSLVVSFYFMLKNPTSMKTGSRGSSVSIVSGYGLDDRAIVVRSPAGEEDFSSSLCV
jgi:hypothetical protein